MPTKPEQSIIAAAKKHLKPQDVLRATIQETPELRQALLDAGLIQEVKE